tara:strand:+ start:1775 stop:1969 length:195 start_codon:yes stop_codon:yes gene_type:complete
MECPKGSTCKELIHQVHTYAKAKEWFNEVTEDHLPIIVRQTVADGGRTRFTIYDKNNNLINTRG